MVDLFKNKFDSLIEKEIKELSDENINNIFNHFKENIIEEIKNQVNINNFTDKTKKNFSNYLLSAGGEIKKKNTDIIQDFSKGTNLFLKI